MGSKLKRCSACTLFMYVHEHAEGEPMENWFFCEHCDGQCQLCDAYATVLREQEETRRRNEQ